MSDSNQNTCTSFRQLMAREKQNHWASDLNKYFSVEPTTKVGGKKSPMTAKYHTHVSSRNIRAKKTNLCHSIDYILPPCLYHVLCTLATNVNKPRLILQFNLLAAGCSPLCPCISQQRNKNDWAYFSSVFVCCGWNVCSFRFDSDIRLWLCAAAMALTEPEIRVKLSILNEL